MLEAVEADEVFNVVCWKIVPVTLL